MTIGIARTAEAATCDSLFSNGAQTHSATGYIEMDHRAQITGGGTQLTTPSIIDDSGWSSCQTGACVASGSFNAPVNVTVPASSGASGAISLGYQGSGSYAAGNYTTVNVGQQAHLTFSTSGGSYYTNTFTSNYRSQLTFAPGDYYINGNLNVGQENPINLSGTGTVRLFVNGSVTFQFKSYSTNTSAARLLIFAKNDITLNNEVNLKGFLYSQSGSVTLQFRANVEGGVSASNRVFLDNESEVNYSSSASTADFGNLCNNSAPAINSFTIDVGAGSASTCVSRAITITARDVSNNKLTGYTGTVAITTSTGRGTWAKTGTAASAYGTLTAGSDNGQATYTFTGTDTGDITLNLANQRAQSLTITVNDATAGKSSTSTTLIFSDNAFVISIPDALGEDFIAGRSHSFTASMIRRDTNTNNCGVATGYNVAGVRMWLTRIAGDPGGTGPVASNNANTSSVTLPNSEPAANNINLNFSSGVANFKLLASDVGKYSVNLKDTSNSFASVAISGSSSTLIARPFGFHISGAGIPGASSATGAIFKKAGEAFSASVRAVAWEAADDANNDGAPENHGDTLPGNNANLSNNAVLVSFGKEVTAERVLMKAALNLPSPGDDPGLTGTTLLTGFNAGAASSNNLVFNNVGIIELSAELSDGDYLGAGAARTTKMVSRSGYVGRFYPDAFSLSDTSIESACSSMLGYSYLGETFTARAKLTARTLDGSVATNYRGAFVKLQAADLADDFGGVDLDSPTPLSTRVILQNGVYSWTNGVMDAVVLMSVARGAALDGPFANTHIGFRPMDTDNVALQAAHISLNTDNTGGADMGDLGTTRLRFGRLRLDDSYGPETAALPVRFLTEYWDGAEWIQNADDSCTLLLLADIRYPQGPIDTAANRSVVVGGGTTTGEYAHLDAATLRMNEGDAGHYFSAPGAGNTGTFSVSVDLANYPWLRFDWNGDGNFADAQLPNAHFTFGSYRGHDRVLYWMETVQ